MQTLPRFVAALGLSAGLLTAVSTFAADAVEPGFKALFNGTDLTGWEGNMDLWSAKDGTITGITKADPKLTHNTFLVYTNSPVDDFEMRFSYRIEKGNSGVQYRSKVKSQGAFGPIVGGRVGKHNGRHEHAANNQYGPLDHRRPKHETTK